MGTVALWGANGAIGRSVAAALRAQGRPYRVVGRSREPLERQFGSDPLAEIATWDPEDPASIRAAAEGSKRSCTWSASTTGASTCTRSSCARRWKARSRPGSRACC